MRGVRGEAFSSVSMCLPAIRNVCVCVSVCLCVCACVRARVCTFLCVCVYIFVCIRCAWFVFLCKYHITSKGVLEPVPRVGSL